jgi:fructose-1,6-bisphosphatase/inositol monophosphatase family enzyme
MLPEPDKVAAVVAEIAAEEMMPRFQALGSGEVREKAPGDFVTVVDEICERRLTEALQALLPGSLVVGEEATHHDPTVIERLGGDDWVWVIDPLDGTRNFAHGTARFASMVALTRGDIVALGVIHDPVAVTSVVAAHGQGAWEGDTRLSVSDRDGLPGMTAAFGKPARGPRREAANRLANAVAEDHRISCAGMAYAALARGEVDIALFARLWPWDHAPGALIHAEAGGHGAILPEGAPYTPKRHQGALLCAPSEAVWHRVAGMLHDLPL